MLDWTNLFTHNVKETSAFKAVPSNHSFRMMPRHSARTVLDDDLANIKPTDRNPE